VQPIRREPLSQERIVDVALTLIDREGAEALTVDRLGAELGVTGMALYKHFPTKDAIQDSVVGRLLTSLDPLDAAVHPREGLARFYRSLWRLFRAHPNVLAVLVSRPLSLPAMHECMARNLGSLRSAGTDTSGAVLALRTLTAYTFGLATLAVGGYLALTADLESPSEQGADAGERRPAVSEDDLDRTFERGLAVVLAGLESQLP
jgi:AcrR family transcriptional regulator